MCFEELAMTKACIASETWSKAQAEEDDRLTDSAAPPQTPGGSGTARSGATSEEGRRGEEEGRERRRDDRGENSGRTRKEDRMGKPKLDVTVAVMSDSVLSSRAGESATVIAVLPPTAGRARATVWR